MKKLANATHRSHGRVSAAAVEEGAVCSFLTGSLRYQALGDLLTRFVIRSFLIQIRH